MRVRGRDCIDLPYSQVPFIERLPPQELYGLVFQGRAFCGWTRVFFASPTYFVTKFFPWFSRGSVFCFLTNKSQNAFIGRKRLCCCCVPSNRRGAGHQMFVWGSRWEPTCYCDQVLRKHRMRRMYTLSFSVDQQPYALSFSNLVPLLYIPSMQLDSSNGMLVVYKELRTKKILRNQNAHWKPFTHAQKEENKEVM